jgi:hypothetical protein
VTGSHLPVDYRGDFEREENRFGPPGQVCDTCSDFELGLLVPVSFCEPALAAAAEYENWLQGTSPEPVWLARPDAMVMCFKGE